MVDRTIDNVVELYEILVDDGKTAIFKYAAHPTYEGSIYISVGQEGTNDPDKITDSFKVVACARSVIEASLNEAGSRDVELRIPVNTPVIYSYGLRIPEVDIYMKFRAIEYSDPSYESPKQLTELQYENAIFWEGRVTSINIEGNEAVITAASRLTAMLDDPIPTVYYQTQCNHVLFDYRCQVPDSLYSVLGKTAKLAPEANKRDLELTLDVPGQISLADIPALGTRSIINIGQATPSYRDIHLSEHGTTRPDPAYKRYRINISGIASGYIYINVKGIKRGDSWIMRVLTSSGRVLTDLTGISGDYEESNTVIDAAALHSAIVGAELLGISVPVDSDLEVYSITAGAANLDSLADDWFKAGHVQQIRTDEGKDYVRETRLILDQVLDKNVTPNLLRLTLNYPFKDFGTTEKVNLFAGCDHTVETCHSKFSDNVARFGGCPFIPLVNAFNEGVRECLPSTQSRAITRDPLITVPTPPLTYGSTIRRTYTRPPPESDSDRAERERQERDRAERDRNSRPSFENNFFSDGPGQDF